MMANPSTYGSGSNSVGGATMAIGLLMAFTGVQVPKPFNMFKVTNNKTKKTWTKEWSFGSGWKLNTSRVMRKVIYDDIFIYHSIYIIYTCLRFI